MADKIDLVTVSYVLGVLSIVFAFFSPIAGLVIGIIGFVQSKKHNVEDKESEEIFDNDPKFIFEDEKHSLSEKRFMVWGITKNGRKLSVFFTIRKGKVRIISARDMHKKERKEYEKRIQENT